MSGMSDSLTPDPDPRVEAIAAGDREALADFFAEHRERLRRMILFRLHPRLRDRIDPDDVVQEAYLAAADRIGHCRATSPQSIFIWLRLIAVQTMIDLHRRHLGAARRDAGREVRIDVGGDGTSASMARHLLAGGTSPSSVVGRAEEIGRLQEAIGGMNEIDREVLALRHFEDLTNAEVAEVLGIQAKAASIRYVRALRRLKEIMARLGHPEGA